MEKLQPQTDSKPLSKKKVLLIVALAVLTLSALGVAGYFLRSSFSGKSKKNEEDVDVLAPMDENLPKFYFPLELVDPSLKAPRTADLKRSDWIGLMKYYNSRIHIYPRIKFSPKHLESIYSMKELVIERVPNQTRVDVHFFYLEGLCRLGKEGMALQIFDSVKNESINFTRHGAPVLFLSKIKGRLQADKVSGILYDAIRNPCVSDEEIIAALDFKEKIDQMYFWFIQQAIKFDRKDLFKHQIDELKKYWHQKECSGYIDQTLLAIQNGIANEPTPNQVEMIDHFIEAAKNHKKFEDACRSMLGDSETNPVIIEKITKALADSQA